jgi:ribosomal protein S18 acetylase RimI-like enzyme
MELNIKNVDPLPIQRELLEIYKRAYRGWEEYAYPTDRRILDYIKWLRKRAPEGFLVAFVNERPTGFIVVDYDWVDYTGEEVGEIHEIVVDPEFQDKGIGKRLLITGLDVLRAKGRRKFSLWVGKGNTKAQTIYKNLGFRVLEERWNTWVRMVKDEKDI